MKVKLIASITLRSEPFPAGAEVNTDEATGNQLIAAGQAEAVVDVPEKPKTPPVKE